MVPKAGKAGLSQGGPAGPGPVAEARIVEKELSYAVTGCAQRVHSSLGPGFPEGVYRRALCRELTASGIPFVAEKSYVVSFRGATCGRFRADIVADERIILELKAASDLCEDNVSQAFAYLEATGLPLAILLNFGRRRLQTKRIVMSRGPSDSGDS